jgi:hypothetical protein
MQNTTQKTKYFEQHELHYKPGVNTGAPER